LALTIFVANEWLKVGWIKRNKNGISKELFPAREGHTPFAKGALSGRLKFKCGGNTPVVDGGNKEILNLHYQVELDSSLGYIRLVPGQKQGRLKSFISKRY